MKKDKKDKKDKKAGESLQTIWYARMGKVPNITKEALHLSRSGWVLDNVIVNYSKEAQNEIQKKQQREGQMDSKDTSAVRVGGMVNGIPEINKEAGVVLPKGAKDALPLTKPKPKAKTKATKATKGKR